MVIFAIRDDDTSFHTDPNVLEDIFGGFRGKVPISLAVVPFSVKKHKSSQPENGAIYPLGDNIELIEWLKDGIKHNFIEVMQHGYDHRYLQSKNTWIPELIWKDKNKLLKEVSEGKKYLSQILNTNIKTFVPPSNSINKNGVKALMYSSLNLSGAMAVYPNRPISYSFFIEYIKRIKWRIRHGDMYPGLIKYKNIKEMRAYTLTNNANYENLLKNLSENINNKFNFILAGHYWEYYQDKTLKDKLENIVEIAQSRGYKYGKVSECFA